MLPVDDHCCDVLFPKFCISSVYICVVAIKHYSLEKSNNNDISFTIYKWKVTDIFLHLGVKRCVYILQHTSSWHILKQWPYSNSKAKKNPSFRDCLSNNIIIWSRECVLYLIIIIKPEVWIINHCLGLGHETMVCAVCLTMFLCSY